MITVRLFALALILATPAAGQLPNVEELEAAWIESAGPVPERDVALPGLRARLEAFGANRGTGAQFSPTAMACWEGGIEGRHSTRIDFSRKPFGPSGDGAFDLVEFEHGFHEGRNCPDPSAPTCKRTGSWPCGAAAELHQSWNSWALENLASGQCTLSQPWPRINSVSGCGGGPCDGRSTEYERWLLSLTEPRCGAVYRSCVWSLANGGSPDRPLTASVLQISGWATEYPERCAVGVHLVPSSICGGWPKWYSVTAERLSQATGCKVTPPPPEPDPDCPICPECPTCPPPVRTEVCEELERIESKIREVRAALDAYSLERCIAALPDGTWATESGGKFCELAPTWKRARLLRLEERAAKERAECRPHRYVPGIPSTGQTPMELSGRRRP